MNEAKELVNIDYSSLFIWISAIIIFIKSLGSAVEWIGKKTGIETKGMRQKREDHELLITTSQNLAELQKRHTYDEKEFKECLTSFIKEQKKENEELRADMRKFADNRVHDREVSIEREKRINVRIDGMEVVDQKRDVTIDNINNGLKKLTDMFIDKQINDYRWEIINFATAISEKKPCSKEGYKHCFSTYEKYEKILEENGLENGEVEISMEIINESYKQKLLEGFK